MMLALSKAFIAYCLLSSVFYTRYTWPKAPLPSNETFLKFDRPTYLIATFFIFYVWIEVLLVGCLDSLSS